MGLELILPFIASVAVTIMLRRLDKSGNRLSQIKRYTERLSEDINQAAISRIQAVKDAGIDLEIGIKQSRKLSEEMHRQHVETTDMMAELQGNRTLLTELSRELHQVIELASEIREESSFIQKGIDYLKERKSDLVSVRKEMDKLQNEASGMINVFHSKLNNRSDEILNSLNTKINELEMLLDKKADSLDESLGILTEHFRETVASQTNVIVNETIQKVDQARNKLDEFLFTLKEAENSLDFKSSSFNEAALDLGEKIEGMEGRLNHKMSESDHRLDEKLKGIETKVQSRFASIFDQVTQTKESFMEGLHSDMDSIRKEIEGMSLETLTRRDEILNDTRRQAEAIKSDIVIFQEKYLEAENKLLKEAENKKQELLKQIDRFQQDFGKLGEKVKDDAYLLTEELMDKLKNFNADMRVAETKAEESLRNKMNSIREDLESSLLLLHQEKEKEFREDLSEIEFDIKELGNQTSKKLKMVDEYVADLKLALSENAREIMEEVETSSSEITAKFNAEVESLDRKVQNWTSSWDSDLGRMREDMRANINALEERIKSIHIEGGMRLDDFKQEYTINREKLTEYRLQLESELKINSERISGKALDGLNEAKEDTEELLMNLKKSARSFFEEQEEKIEHLNKTLDTKISRQLTSLMDKGQLQFGQLEDKVAKYVKEVKLKMEETLKETSKESDAKIEEFQSKVQKSFHEIDSANHEFISRNKHEFNKVKQEFESIQIEIANSMKEIQENKKSIIEHLEFDTTKITDEVQFLTQKMKSLQSSVDTIEQVASAVNQSEVTLNKFSTMMDMFNEEKSSFEEIEEQSLLIKEMQNNLENEIDRIQARENDLAEIDRKIDSLFEAVRDVKSIAGDISEKEKSLKNIDETLNKYSAMETMIIDKMNSLEETKKEIGIIHSMMAENKGDSTELLQKIADIEHGLGILTIRENELTENLEKVEMKASNLLQKDKEIRAVEAKFNQIEDLMGDLSERHTQVSALQGRMEYLKKDMTEMKDELEGLLSEADEKFDKLSAFFDVISATGGSASGSAAIKSKNDVDMSKRKAATVKQLYDKFHWSSDIIAEKLNIEKSLVDTIINSSR